MNETRTARRTVEAGFSSARRLSVAALTLALVAVVVVLMSGGASYTIHARFENASGLVDGDSVELGGVGVGSVTGIGLASNGLADVTLSMHDGAITPLHAGTRATIRALSQAGLANHYVALTLGAQSAPLIPEGSVLPAEQTTSLVNYDAVLDMFGPTTRADIQRLIADSGKVYAGSGARVFNLMLDKLSPAAGQLNGMMGALAEDRGALTEMIHSGAIAAQAIAARSPQLMSAVANTATTMRAIGQQRGALADALTRAPAVLDRGTLTLTRASAALRALRPALQRVPAAAEPLREFMTKLDATLPATAPVIRTLRADLPGLRSSLGGLQSLRPIADKALSSATDALDKSRPIVTAFRYYGTDLLIGVFGGLAGIATGNYDQYGHYVRLDYAQPYQNTLGGPFAGVLSKPLVPSLFNLRTKLYARCPGGNAPPAPDGSSPWVPVSGICNPADDTPLSVDFP